MEFIDYLNDTNIIAFILLFARISGIFAFFPFFAHNNIPIFIKATLAFFLTMFLFPLIHIQLPSNNYFFILQILSEILLGMTASLALSIVFAIIQMAGELIAFTMGFTMANVIDPSSNINMPIISQILSLIALLVFLAFDGHHLILTFLTHSLKFIELGNFYPQENLLKYLTQALFGVFVLGFSIAFPVLALNLLADFIFGLLMKTMPQFNLLVVGFPIKIALAFVVLIAILVIMMQYFKQLIIEVFSNLETLFFI